jgi:hypothetical protein
MLKQLWLSVDNRCGASGWKLVLGAVGTCGGLVIWSTGICLFICNCSTTSTEEIIIERRIHNKLDWIIFHMRWKTHL